MGRRGREGGRDRQTERGKSYKVQYMYSAACISFYYKHASNPAEPPTAVRNLTVIDTTNTSITIEWEPPEEIGRDDCYYNVEHSDPNDISKYIQHEESINCSDTTMYDVTGLQPITTYIIRISVHNGVSGNDSQNDDRRRRQINGTTQEGSKPLMYRIVYEHQTAPVGAFNLCKLFCSMLFQYSRPAKTLYTGSTTFITSTLIVKKYNNS